MFPMDEHFGRARVEQFERMMANSRPRGRPHHWRTAFGRALLAAGSRLIGEEGRMRVD